MPRYNSLRITSTHLHQQHRLITSKLGIYPKKKKVGCGQRVMALHEAKKINFHAHAGTRLGGMRQREDKILSQHVIRRGTLGRDKKMNKNSRYWNMLGGSSARSGLRPLVKKGMTAPKKTVVKTITPKEVVTMRPLCGSCTCTT